MKTLRLYNTKIQSILFTLIMVLLNGVLVAQNGVGVNTTTPKSNFEVNGSFGQTVTTVTSSTTLDGNQSLIVCNNGSNAINITLPTVSTCSGRIYTIKRNSTSTANITLVGTIDGVTNYILQNTNESVTIFSNGSEWKTLSNYNSQSAWNTSGNSGTDSTTNFIGTNDAQALTFKTNDTSRMKISNNGDIILGDDINHLKIEADGTLLFEGNATIWDDLRVTLDRGADATAIGYLSGSSGPQIYFFRNNQNVEAMSFTVQLPHSWKEGSTIYPHIHWMPKSSASGNVEWNFEYTWVNYDPNTPQAFPGITTSTVVTNGPFVLNTHLISPLTANNVGISGTGKKVSSILVCRIWRDSSRANDTYGSDAGALFVDFHYEINSFGSHLEYVK